eukprot:5147491-Pyramimonas_sp.AAC.1
MNFLKWVSYQSQCIPRYRFENLRHQAIRARCGPALQAGSSPQQHTHRYDSKCSPALCPPLCP